MKIAFVTAFYTPAIGGIKQVVEEVAERYVKQGHKVHVFCSDSDKEKRLLPLELELNGVKVHRHKYILKLSKFTYVWPSLLKTLKKQKFDVIHAHGFGQSYTYFAAKIAKKTNTPFILTTHCPWTTQFREFWSKFFLFTYNITGRYSFENSDRIIAITPWEYDFIKKYGGTQEKIINIPNGMHDYLFKKIKPNNFRKNLGISEKDKLVLSFGRLNVTKGVDILAKVAVKLTKERKDLNFVFVGPDEGMKDTVAKIIKGHERIWLLDPIRDKKKVAEMYQAADLYALPSYREGLPLTLFEAMAGGLPVVACPVNGIPYEMKVPENGLFIPYGDKKALEDAILKILDNPKLAKEMIKNNVEKAKHYNWNEIAERTMKVYLEEIEKKHRA